MRGRDFRLSETKLNFQSTIGRREIYFENLKSLVGGGGVSGDRPAGDK
jgi:hypothetical protein